MEQSFQNMLKRHWGYSSFRDHQFSICNAVIHKKDVFAVLGTGSGKSLLYQLPPVALRSIGVKSTAVVISPLISLISDQIGALTAMGIPAASIDASSTSETETRAIQGEYAVLYLTPEKFCNWKLGLQELAHNVNICCVVIDECHMISEWGHDFRSSYRKLGQLRDWAIDSPIMALTATATNRVQNDVINILRLASNALIVRASINRPNLKYFVVDRNSQNDLNRLLLFKYRHLTNNDASKSSEFSSLIYVPTRLETENVSNYINESAIMRQSGIVAAYYHAGLTTHQREEVYVGFMTGKYPVVVATTAFGMGINKPDIRIVINFGMPTSVESYHQMTGRAGRDGLPAECVLMFHRNDIAKCQTLLFRSAGNNGNNSSHQTISASIEMQQGNEAYREQYRRLRSMADYCKDLKTCRRQYILQYFEEADVTDRNSSSSQPQQNCCDICDEMSRKKHSNSASVVPSIPLEFQANGACTATTTGSENTPNQIDMGYEILMLLRTIQASGEFYGLGVITGILHGSHEKTVQRVRNYDSLETFGKGEDQTKEFWKELAYQLADNENLLRAETVSAAAYSYQRYSITPKGLTFLREHRNVSVAHEMQQNRLVSWPLHPSSKLWHFASSTMKLQHRMDRKRSAVCRIEKYEKEVDNASYEIPMITHSFSWERSSDSLQNEFSSNGNELPRSDSYKFDVEAIYNGNDNFSDNDIPKIQHDSKIRAVEQINLGNEVLLLLQSIQDCGECYGMELPISILLGKHTASVQRVLDYDSFPSFGKGKYQNHEFWKALVLQLVDEQLLASVPYKFSSYIYSLSYRGKEFLQRYSDIGAFGERPTYLLCPSNDLSSHISLQGLNNHNKTPLASSDKFTAIPPPMSWKETAYDEQLRKVLNPLVDVEKPTLKLYKPNYLYNGNDHDALETERNLTLYEKTDDDAEVVEDPYSKTIHSINQSESAADGESNSVAVQENPNTTISRTSSLNNKTGSAGLKAAKFKHSGIGSFVKRK